MIYNLLADSTTTSATQSTAQTSALGGNWTMYIFMGVILLLFIVYMVFSRRRSKKQEQEFESLISALKVGDRILTIGRWYGEIVEILPDDMFVVKTGSDEHPGYVTIDKNTIAHIFKEQPAAAEVPTELPPAQDDEVFEQEGEESAVETTETSEQPETTVQTEEEKEIQ